MSDAAAPRTPAGSTPETEAPVIRRPTVGDGAGMWALVQELADLEENSLYAYLLLGFDYAETCRVAVRGTKVLGMVAGYRRPAEPETLFVWQVGVHPDAQRRGLASRMILDILETEPGFRFLEATVAEGNGPSDRLFRGIAARAGVACKVLEGFTSRHFGPQEHPPEPRYRIGPLGRTT